MKRPTAGGIALATVVMAGAGCATTPTPLLIQPSNTSYHETVFEGSKILVVAPHLRSMDVETERELRASKSTASAMSALMTAHARTTALQQGFEVVSANDIPELQVGSLAQSLDEISRGSSDLLKVWSKGREQLVATLQILREATGADAVLLQATTMKIGQQARWDAVMTGRVLAGTSSSDLTVGLVDMATGGVVWKQEAFYRDVLNIDTMDRLLKMVFEYFPRRHPSET